MPSSGLVGYILMKLRVAAFSMFEDYTNGWTLLLVVNLQHQDGQRSLCTTKGSEIGPLTVCSRAAGVSPLSDELDCIIATTVDQVLR